MHDRMDLPDSIHTIIKNYYLPECDKRIREFDNAKQGGTTTQSRTPASTSKSSSTTQRTTTTTTSSASNKTTASQSKTTSTTSKTTSAPTKTSTTTSSSSSKAPSQNYTSSYTNQTRSGTTTTHSSVSTKQTAPKWKRWSYYYISPMFGLSASYAERALHVSGGDLDQPVEVDYFVDEEAMRGFRIGIDIFPSESWDMGLFGIHTGLFYEMYFCSWDSVPSNDYYDRYFEGSLSVPLDLTFTIPFGKHSGLQLYGGLVADVTLFNQLYFSGDSFSEPNKNLFGTNYLKRFNLAYEYGVTLHLKGVMLHASLQTGLTRHPTFEGYATSVNKFTVGLSRVF